MDVRAHVYTHATPLTIQPKEEATEKQKSANTASGSGNRYNIPRETVWSRSYGATPPSVHCYTKVHRAIAHFASGLFAVAPH